VPEGWLFAALALVAQTTVIYEALPVFLCARTKREGYALAVLTFVAAFGHYLAFGVPTTVARQSATLWRGFYSAVSPGPRAYPPASAEHK
jgi:hypothetical protein